MDRLLADDAKRGRDVAAELRLQRDDLALEHLAHLGGETNLHLDRHPRLEVRAVDERQLGVVEHQRALAEKVDVEVHVDAREAGILVQRQLLPVDADLAIRDQTMRVGAGHDHPRPRGARTCRRSGDQSQFT